MQANTNVIRNEAQAPPIPWEEARGWTERLCSRERLVSTGIAVAGVTAFLGLLGVVEYALYQMVHNWSISGVGATVFGYF